MDFDVLARIRDLLSKSNMNMYELAKRSHIPQSTLSSMFNKSTCPTIPTLESICKGFGITLSEFFAPLEDENITKDIDQMTTAWKKLDDKKKEAYKVLLEIE